MTEGEIAKSLEVCCRICAQQGKDYRTSAGKLLGHIGGAHRDPKWTKQQYIDTFGPEAEADLWIRKPTPEERREKSAQITALNAAKPSRSDDDGVLLESLVETGLDTLTESEREFYDQQIAHVTQATDRDELQAPAISSMVMDMIILRRLRRSQLQATGGKEIALPLKGVEEAVKGAEDRYRKAMDALGISREAQHKRGAAIKSTPAAILSGYFDEIERMSPEMLDALALEERRLYGKMKDRLDRFIFNFAPDIEKKDESDDGSDEIISLEDALNRAGLTL